MLTYDKLIKIVEVSVAKNGPDKPLTLSHFLNILKMAEKQEFEEQEDRANQEERIMNSIRFSHHGSNE